MLFRYTYREFAGDWIKADMNGVFELGRQRNLRLFLVI